MKQNVIVKKSQINGKGVFAAVDFKKGEVVLGWNPKPIKKADISKLPKNDLKYAGKFGGRYHLMQPPERYVNHSCEPNTKVKNKSDVAIRNIKKGEEITSTYSKQLTGAMECRCGSKECKKIIN